MKMNKEFDNSEPKFEIDDSMDYIIDEKGNQYIALRKVSWFGTTAKLELRKWVSKPDGDVPMKGVSFLTDEGPNELVKCLISEGYGEVDDILKSLSMRQEFTQAIKKYTGSSSNSTKKSISPIIKNEESFYDPKEIF